MKIEPETEEFPKVIGTATAPYKELLKKWRADNRGVPWSVLIRRGLAKELKPYAGKRLAHLLDAAPVVFFALLISGFPYSS